MFLPLYYRHIFYRQEVPTYSIYRLCTCTHWISFDITTSHSTSVYTINKCMVNLHSTRYAIEVYSLNKNVPLLHTQWGITAVYSASAEGHSEVVKLLVQAGADLELQREVY